MAIKARDSSGKSIHIAGRGRPGSPGADGKSAYQYAVEGGYTGTEAEFQTLMANVGEPPDLIPFQLMEGWVERYGGSEYGIYAHYFCKALNGLITLSLDVYQSNPVKGPQTLGILPEGFRPKVDTCVAAVDNHSLKILCVNINPNGQVAVYPIVTADAQMAEIEYQYVRFTLSFYS